MDFQRRSLQLLQVTSRIGNEIHVPKEFAAEDNGAVWKFSEGNVHITIETNTLEGSPDPDDFFEASLRNFVGDLSTVAANDFLDDQLCEAGVLRKSSLLPQCPQNNEDTWLLYIIVTEQFMHTIQLQTTMSTLALSESFFDAIVASFRGI